MKMKDANIAAKRWINHNDECTISGANVTICCVTSRWWRLHRPYVMAEKCPSRGKNHVRRL